jgi:hypothetical protein
MLRTRKNKVNLAEQSPQNHSHMHKNISATHLFAKRVSHQEALVDNESFLSDSIQAKIFQRGL